jgi:predicted nucleic acid-binding Zn ribbon protein
VPADPPSPDRSGPDGDVGIAGPDSAAGTDVEVAARIALARARAAARARGLKPGQTAANAAQAARRRARVAGQGRMTGAGPDARDPQLFGTTVDRIIGERGWSTDVAVGGVMGRWGQIVGPEVAAHVTPETFQDGVLTVRADSTAWATQVRLLVPALLGRLAEELGDGVVDRVNVAGPGGPSWRKGQRRVPGRGPRDTYG